MANAPSLTESEIGIRARDWAEVLFDVVPRQRLFDAYKRAAHDHKTSFPISYHDLVIAYEQISDEEIEARPVCNTLQEYYERLEAEGNLPECMQKVEMIGPNEGMKIVSDYLANRKTEKENTESKWK